MTVTLPRIDADAARAILDRAAGRAIADVSAMMPIDEDVPVTYAPTGGGRIDAGDPFFEQLRDRVTTLACEHGFPGQLARRGEFEGRCARLVHEELRLTPHEAATEGVWSYLTCCWLLDVALWRWDGSQTVERYVGHINRNTFRRMWWRAEILGPTIDLALLTEDEYTALLERPTIASDRRLARAIAAEILERAESGRAAERMSLVRDAMKRILRLSPIVALGGLGDEGVDRVVRYAFDSSEAALSGQGRPTFSPERPPAPAPSENVFVDSPAPDTAVDISAEYSPRARDGDFEALCEAAAQIARRTGMVTNATLRDAGGLDADGARVVLQTLVARGALEQRGAKRGTHYVIPTSRNDGPIEAVPRAPIQPPHHTSTLRRLLRRGPHA
jgi:hypothetical protein